MKQWIVIARNGKRRVHIGPFASDKAAAAYAYAHRSDNWSVVALVDPEQKEPSK